METQVRLFLVLLITVVLFLVIMIVRVLCAVIILLMFSIAITSEARDLERWAYHTLNGVINAVLAFVR